MERDEWLKTYLREIEKVAAESPALDGEYAVHARMIRANLRLVVKIAQEQRGSLEVPLLDLVAVGNIGLVKAVKRFDPEKEGTLAVFAGWWIRQSIRREVAKSAKLVAAGFADVQPHVADEDDLALPA